MNLSRWTSVAAVFVATLATAGEPPPLFPQPRRYAARAFFTPAEGSWPQPAVRPIREFQERQQPYYYDVVTLNGAGQFPPSGQQAPRLESPGDPLPATEPPPDDEFYSGAESVADRRAEPPVSQVSQITEPPQEPSADIFEQELPGEPPADGMPAEEAEAPPDGEMPFSEPPEEDAAAPANREAQPGIAPPRRRTEPAPPQELPEPPTTERLPAQHEPEQSRSAPYRDDEMAPDLGEAFGDYEGDFGEGCMSCAQSAAFCGYWDHFCPPPKCFCIPPGTWVNLDYLMFWSRGTSLPPLVTTGSVNGALNDPNLQVLVGSDRVDTQIRSGGRLNVGTWFNEARTWGIGGTFVDLQNVATNAVNSSPGSPLLARPFYDVTDPAAPKQAAFVEAQEGISSARIKVRTTNSFIAGDAYLRTALHVAPDRRIDLVYGWRYLQLGDSLNIDDQLVSTNQSGIVPLGTTVTGLDIFRATNKFNGFQFGFMGEKRQSIWSLATTAKVALGTMHQTVLIDGITTIAVPGLDPVVSPGSLLALPSNIGRYDRNVFSAVPELTLNLGAQITPRLRATIGYSLIYISNVAQSSQQVDTSIDTSQIGGTTPGTAPTFQFHQNGFWLQGLTFGAHMRF